MYSLKVQASRRWFALTTQISCPLHQPLSCGKEKQRVESLNPSSVKGIFITGFCFIDLTFYLFHVLYSFRPLTLEWTVLYNVISEHTSYLKSRSQEDGSRLISVVPSNRTSGNRHKLKHRIFHLSMREKKCLRVTEH